jgi:hypothetical protein
MTVIKVPRPKRSAMDPDRPVNALLQAQIEHLQYAERRIPLHYRSKIYTHAIRTEGEAAAYIKHLTEAIHQAHEDAAKERAKQERRRKKGLTLVAAAERRSRKRRSSTKAKKSSSTRSRKKRS